MTYNIHRFSFGDYASSSILLLIIIYSMFQIIVTSFLVPIVVEILLKSFTKKCSSIEDCDKYFTEDCELLIKEFEEMETVFENFFLTFYTYVQLFSIFTIFTTILYFFSSSKLIESGNYIEIGGLTLFMFCYIYKLDFLTLQVENAFQSVKHLGKTVEQKLLKTQNKSERQHLKYLSKMIDKIKPFSACGYFDIGKGTLTSMLSVRSVRNLKNEEIYRDINFLFQFDIHHHFSSISAI